MCERILIRVILLWLGYFLIVIINIMPSISQWGVKIMYYTIVYRGQVCNFRDKNMNRILAKLLVLML